MKCDAPGPIRRVNADTETGEKGVDDNERQARMMDGLASLQEKVASLETLLEKNMAALQESLRSMNAAHLPRSS